MRPKKTRNVLQPPLFNRFKPMGMSTSKLDEAVLSLDEYEAIRLADLEDLDHQAAASLMNISRPTFTRLIESARKKVATFLVKGRKLVIDGGVYEFEKTLLKCESCHEVTEMVDQEMVCGECASTEVVELNCQYRQGECAKRRERRRYRKRSTPKN